MYEQYELDLGIPAGIGSIRGIGNPQDRRRAYGEIPVSGYSLGINAPANDLLSYPLTGSDQIVARPGYEAIPRGTRSADPARRRNTPLLAYEELKKAGNYQFDSPSAYKTVSEGEWTPDDSYLAGSDRRVGRPEKGIEPLLSGSADSVVLRDPQLISGRLSQPTGNYPQSALGPRPSGEVSADEVIFSPRSGVLPTDIGEILADYGAKSNIRTGMPFPERSIDPNQADETGFSSLDPTQVGGKGGGSNINPYGVVEMPAIGKRGDWKDDYGRPLIARIDPRQVVEVRTANSDATFTADQTEEISLGQKAEELREENRTPVLSASRLEELRKQGRAVRAPGEGSEIGKVALYDLEDRLIVRGPQGDFVAPNQNYAIQEGERVVGVRKAVPVYRVEPIYRPVGDKEEQVSGKRTVPDGRSGVREETDDLYRVGNPMSYDRGAVREGLQPLISGSGSVGKAVRVGQGDLNVALQRGTARFFDQRSEAAEAERQLALPLPGVGVQTYVERGGMAPALIAPRTRPDGTPIPGAFLVEDTSQGRRPVGPAPFLLPPQGSTEEEAKVIGGIRRRGERIEPGMEFDQLISAFSKGSYMSDPDIANGYATIAEMISNGQVTPQQLVEKGVIRPGTREAVLLSQAISDRRPGQRVDLFAEKPFNAVEREFARQSMFNYDDFRGLTGGAVVDQADFLETADQGAGSIEGDERVGRWGDFGDGGAGAKRGFSVQSLPIEGQSQIEPFVQYAQALTGDRKQAEYLAEVAIRGTRPRAEGSAVEAGDVIRNIRFMSAQPVYSGRSEGGRQPAIMKASEPQQLAAAVAPSSFPANPSMRQVAPESVVVQGDIPGIPTDSASLNRGYTPDPIDDVARYMERQAGKPSYRYVVPNRAGLAMRLARQLNLLSGR